MRQPIGIHDIRGVHARGVHARGLAAWVVIGCALAACIPPISVPTFVPQGARPVGRNGLDLRASAGGGYPGAGIFAASLEKFFTPRASLTAELFGGIAGVSADHRVPGGGGIRVGGRWRVGRLLTLGGGLSGSASVTWMTWDDGTRDTLVFGALGPDFEVALGRTWGIFGLSFTVRPSVQFFVPSWFAGVLYVPMSLSGAIYLDPKRTVAISLSLVGGMLWIFNSGADSGETNRPSGAGGALIGVLIRR